MQTTMINYMAKKDGALQHVFHLQLAKTQYYLTLSKWLTLQLLWQIEATILNLTCLKNTQ